jgi:hypothetical protein
MAEEIMFVHESENMELTLLGKKLRRDVAKAVVKYIDAANKEGLRTEDETHDILIAMIESIVAITIDVREEDRAKEIRELTLKIMQDEIIKKKQRRLPIETRDMNRTMNT